VFSLLAAYRRMLFFCMYYNPIFDSRNTGHDESIKDVTKTHDSLLQNGVAAGSISPAAAAAFACSVSDRVYLHNCLCKAEVSEGPSMANTGFFWPPQESL
jgi:hypothetical protein